MNFYLQNEEYNEEERMSDTNFNPFEQYFERSNALNILKNTCAGADDGELFIERRRSEN